MRILSCFLGGYALGYGGSQGGVWAVTGDTPNAAAIGVLVALSVICGTLLWTRELFT